MADLRKETHGSGSMKGVNLAVIAYDSRVARKDGEITNHYLDMRIHPSDKRAVGQTSLALVAKPDPKSPSGWNNSYRYRASQFESIKAAAGDNVVDLTNSADEVVGKIYGIKADLMIAEGKVLANTKALSPSDFSVAPDEAGLDIRTRIYTSMSEAQEAEKAKAAAAPTATTPEATAPKATAPKRGPIVEAEAEAPQPSIEEPALG